jgi:steroid delta-isomerase-like uncharacterized protein
MSLLDNKAICRRHYEEVLSAKQLSVVDEIYAPQIGYGTEGQSLAREQLRQLAAASTTAFPDLAVTVQAQIAEGDLVTTRWSATGTHLGDFMGHPATGKVVTIHAIHIHRIKDGRICHLWEEIDLLGLTKQLGITLP